MLLPKTFLLLYLLLLSTSFIPNGTTARELVKPTTGGQTPVDAARPFAYRALSPRSAVPSTGPGLPYTRRCKYYRCRPPVP